MCQIFWGIFLFFLGASIIINVVTGLNIPVLKLFLAVMLIYFSIKILFSPSQETCSWQSYSSASKECMVQRSSEAGDWYEVRFGTSTIDLRHLNSLTEPKTVRIEAQFANTTVILPHAIPVRVKADVSFGSVHLPGKPEHSEYLNLHGATEPLLTVFIESAFSSVTVRE